MLLARKVELRPTAE